MTPQKYGTALTFYYPLLLAGQYLTSTPTLDAGDFQISKDGGVFADLATLPSYANGQLVITLSATEMQAARSAIRLIDQTSTAEWDEDWIIIETYGNASAAHEVFPADISGTAIAAHFVDTINDASITLPTSETSFDVANGDRFRAGNVIRVDGSAELMYVRAVSSNTITVIRGYLGTTAVAIADTQTLLISSGIPSSQAIILTTTGLTVYAQFFNAWGQIWNGSAFETYNVSNWATYNVAMTEIGTTGQYRVAVPSTLATHFVSYAQAGGSPASSDVKIYGATL